MHIIQESNAYALRRVLVAAAILTVASPTAWPQSATYRLLCMNHGTNPSEPIGDRDGHALQAGDSTCSVQGGPLDGAVVTQQVVWEYDKGVATLVSSQSVYRKPGTVAVAVGRSGKLTLKMTEGRVTGWDASGSVSYVMATGGATGLEGKNANWTATPTGNRTYVIEVNAQ